LEQYRGHLLNWYDTRSMQPLAPRYISTVDSGNLAACLITLKQGLSDLRHAPLLRWQFWEGWLDTLGMLADAIEEIEGAGTQLAQRSLHAGLERVREQVLEAKHNPAAWVPMLKTISEERWPELDKALSALVESAVQGAEVGTLQRLHLFADRVRGHLDSARRELDSLLPEKVLHDVSFDSLTLANLPGICRSMQAWLAGSADGQNRQSADLDAAGSTAQALLSTLNDIAQQAERYIRAMDFAFLFDARRQVFHIGYNVEAARLDDNCYDLLASEARIASLVAIAKDDVPPSHWLHLGRPLTQVNGARCLLSWSATMFEYLMPSLLMRSLNGTLLQESSRVVVQRQIAYAGERRVPWGISEAGYYAFDTSLNYQYRAFGVPDLGFKRELADDLVIAPYASLLALRFNTRAVADNIARLIRLKMLGTHGFYESVDYTTSRIPLGASYAVVRSYMAHHQGMILVSLVNHLHNDVMVNRFHADLRMQSVEMLLQERVPYDVPLEPLPTDEATPTVRQRQPPMSVTPWFDHKLTQDQPAVALPGVGENLVRPAPPSARGTTTIAPPTGT
jgi:cyclic beta-1,2-glucan synthetase